MQISKIVKPYLSFLAAIVTAGAASMPANAAGRVDATMNLQRDKAGFVVGGSGGSGALHYKGKNYPLSIGCGA